MIERALARAAVGRRSGFSPLTEADSFAKQWAWVATASRFNAVMCSRRAGKTKGAVRRAALRLMQAKRVLYINQTATNAELQFYQPLRALLDKKGIKYHADDANLILYMANGGLLRAVGCNDVGQVKTKLGDGWDEIFIDEMQDYSEDVLYRLIDKAILPMLIDTGGTLHCMGTPPMTLGGFWFDMWKREPSPEARHRFVKWKWTLLDNPYIEHDWFAPYEARGLTMQSPVVRRECFGEIVVDPNAVVFCYESPRNDIVAQQFRKDRWVYRSPRGQEWPETNRPDPDHKAWRYSMGIDLGLSDHDAIVVLGWRMDDGEKRLYECWSWQENHLDYLKLAEVFKVAVEKWQPQKICVDTGGHCAVKVMESLKAAFSMYQFERKPASLLDSIALVNDELRTGRMLVDPNGLVAHDAPLVVWREGKHGVEVSEAFHSDIMAALRYAHHVAYHYQAEAPKNEEESDEDRHVREWLEREEIRRDPHNPYRGGNSSYD